MNRWKSIKGISYFEFSEILKNAQRLHQEHSEPIPDIGKEGIGKIESSLATPFQSYGGKSLYVGFYKKATILFYLLIKNHCLQNGNKRMAILSLSYFCFVNKRTFHATQLEIYDLAKQTATSNNQHSAMKVIEKVLRKKTIYKNQFAKAIENSATYRFSNRTAFKKSLIRSKYKCFLQKAKAK